MEELVHSAWSMIPFAIMLLMIAVAPLVAEKWWESNINKLIVSLVLGIPVAVCLIMGGMGHNFEHQMLFDYVPFIILLLSLFVVTGGINLSGDIKATPGVNTLFLGIGFLLASLMGTTGAAMLLIRPVLTTNQQRKHKLHTVLFFIALVANCGGLMTPLGDPPLFMLFLRGVSFTWFMGMWAQWIFTGALLLLIYYIVDKHEYKKEDQEALARDAAEVTPIKLKGNINFIYLIGIVLSVALINEGFIPEMGNADAPVYIKYLREIALLIITALSYFTTKKEIRFEANKFTWTPIVEVAVLFLGIFATMTPALAYLSAHAGELGLDSPTKFYYVTGLLSSFLDNTPTAVAFYEVGSGLPTETLTAMDTTMLDMVNGAFPQVLLQAISIGAVFFGAMTYIGNGPNFMVKSIAEESGIKMPSFFAYMYKFSLIVLLPIYILVQLLFIWLPTIL
ncbi:MAG: sodium:proton antiporter [Paludibacteraceae bacterium]|nr:sodium:proton antiporter [Paludibacteraceae bacterium]